MKAKEQIDYNIVDRLLDLELDNNMSNEVLECILNAKDLNDLDILENGLKKLLDK